MKKYFQRARKTLNEFNNGLEDIAIASLEIRVKGFQRAIKDGWFKHFLIGAGIAGTGLVYTGLTNDNDYVAGVGYGALAMTGLYSLPSYVLPAFKKLRNKNTKESDN